ncbi:hypothetical protein [Paraferrimonas sp. SM1919]|uniref:hypothetical protein n=1 Tax=Paraferrimonas sp. SM1919 TaxID=2662263 RepID=UPI0013D219A3|nr:hypothetical protein [Paraferrimonas sp. SM1919]
MKITAHFITALIITTSTMISAQESDSDQLLLGDWQCRYDIMGFKDTAHLSYRSDHTMTGSFDFVYPGMHGKGAFGLSLDVEGNWKILNGFLVEDYKPNKTRLNIAYGFTPEDNNRFQGDGLMKNKAEILALTKNELVLKEQDGNRTSCNRG